MCRGGTSGRPMASNPTSPITASTTSRIACAERKLALIDRSRNSGARRPRPPAPRARSRTSDAHLVELARIGALEAVDGLLEVADHEQGAVRPSASRRAAEIFLGQRADDVPLRGVGVLRFVDEDVVGALVELVAHPFAHSGLGQQPARPADQIVEIGDAGAALGLRISVGEGPPRAKPRGHVVRRAARRSGFAANPRSGRPGARHAPHNAARALRCPAETLRSVVIVGQDDLAQSGSAAARSIGVSASHRSMTSAWPRPVCAPHAGWLRRSLAAGRNRSGRRRNGWTRYSSTDPSGRPISARSVGSMVSSGPSAASASWARAQRIR